MLKRKFSFLCFREISRENFYPFFAKEPDSNIMFLVNTFIFRTIMASFVDKEQYLGGTSTYHDDCTAGVLYAL